MTTAIVFPGQGSQSIGMLASLADSYKQVQATFSEASEVLGRDLWDMTQHGPEESLNTTTNTQPVMLTAGIAVWRVWQEQGGAAPAYLAGHSLGEYTALVAAGVMEFADAVALVADRGRYMQEAVAAGEGAMAAVLGIDDETLQSLCASVSNERSVTCANFNAPGQVVIAGHADAVERAVEQAREAGAKRAVTLSVSVPSHCGLMRPAAEKLAERLQQINLGSPKIPVVHNVDYSCQTDPEVIREKLVAQLYSPVYWTQSVSWLASQGVNTVLEFGPGKVLAGLGKRIDRSLASLPVYDADSLGKALATGE